MAYQIDPEILEKAALKQTLDLYELDEYRKWQRSVDDAQNKIDGLEEKLRVQDGIIGSVVPKGQTGISQVSQITQDLGDMIAGRFIAPSTAATSTEPTDSGFSGTFMSGDAETFGSDSYHIGGVNAGNLQFGISATDGKAYLAGGDIVLNSDGIILANVAGVITFLALDGSEGAYIFNQNTNDLTFQNNKKSAGFTFNLLQTDDSTPYMQWAEDEENANVPLLILNEDGTTPARLIIGGQSGSTLGVSIWANSDGKETVFNDNGYDIDFRVSGADDENLLKIDFGLDAIGMGGAAESGYKLKVHGDVNLSSGNTYDINGSPHGHTSIQLVTTHGRNAQVPASSTEYLLPYDMTSGLFGSIGNIQVPACTVKNLRVANGTTVQPASGDLVVAIYKNSSPTGVTLTITNGDGTTANFEDTTHEVSFAAGDLLSFGFANAATANSTTIRTCSVEMHIPTG